MPVCPLCQEEIDHVDYVSKGSLFYETYLNTPDQPLDKPRWRDPEPDNRTYSCPKCHGELDVEDLEALGIG